MRRKLCSVLLAVLLLTVCFVSYSSTVYAKTALSITKQPVSVVVQSGTTAKVSITVAGDGLAYKWYYKNVGDSKFTHTTTFKGNSYSLEMNKSRSGRQVYCVVTDKYGKSVKSKTATLYMGTPLKITKQPTNTVAKNGATAKVSFTAKGDGLTYKWYYKNAGSSKFTLTKSFTKNTYSAEMNKSRSGRQVYCVVTDKYGKSVKTDVATLYMGNPLTITKQPKSANNCSGKDVKVSFTATGDGLKYKWYYKDAGSSKFTATSSFKGNSYTTSMSNRRDGRQIYCVVTDKYGVSVKTDVAALTVSHAFDTGVIKSKSTCKVNGEKVYTCRKCSHTVTELLPKTDHAMSEWKVVREATVTLEGVERSTCAHCGYYKDRSLAKLKAVYYITANVGTDTPVKVGVAANGKYTLADPTRLGYNFAGWQTTDGQPFDKQGVVSGDITINAVWELDGTDTLAELVERTDGGVDRILITGDITLDQPIYITYNTTIYADEDHTLLRAPGYNGDLFVVGRDRQNVSASLQQRQAVLTLGGGKGMLTIDGNRDNLTTTVVGSAVFASDSSVLNLYDGVRIANNKKLGNKRIFFFTDVSGEWTHKKAGGAAIINLRSTVNMYGGILENNLVATEYTVVTNEDGTTSNEEQNACGGALYNRGNFNMYGGTITTSEALRGGGIYTDWVTYLFAGTVSDNVASVFGGGLASSSSMNADIYVGTEGDSRNKMVFSGNLCEGVGGAMYSNTSSPIIILGNATFENNTGSSGGAIYTAGPLTAENAYFVGNTTAGSGGAIYHHYTKAEFQRRQLSLENCVFENNKGNLGGAVIFSATGAAATAGDGTIGWITGCTFTGNEAVLKTSTTESGDTTTSLGSGGAIYITKNGVAAITDCTFTKNVSTGNAGGVAAQGGTDVTITNCAFTENTALQGGGLYTSGAASLKLTDLTFNGNCANANAKGGAGLGGAMYIDGVQPTTKNIDLLNNTAGVHGGAVYMRAITLNVDEQWTVSGNKAGQHGGAFYLVYKTNEDNTRTGAVLNATNTVFSGNSAMAGGAVSARSSCTVTMDNCQLTNNSVEGYVDDKNDGEAEGGGAIYVGYGEVTLHNVTATGNTASDFGGVVTATGSPVTVTGGTFTDNTANSGGVIFARNGSTVTIDDATLNENESPYVQSGSFDSNVGGGAVNVTGGTLGIKNTTLNGNKSGYYGGAVLVNKSTVTIGENTVVSNSTGATGAALYFKGGSTVTIADTDITDNISNGNGVIYHNAGTLNMQNVTATGNQAASGGVLFTSGATTKITLENNVFSGNTANAGGAIYMDSATVNITDCEMKNNTAKNGGAVYNKLGALRTTDTDYTDNSATAGSGGAICMAGGTVDTVGDSKFIGNSATNHAGAIYASYFTNEDKTRTPAILTADGTAFLENTAMGGGAVSVRSDCAATLKSVTMTDNTAIGNDGKADGNGEGGGAVYVGYGELVMENVTAIGNTSEVCGGAVQVIESTVSIKDNTYTENAGGYGGAVYVSPVSTATIENVTFTDNTSTGNAGALYVAADRLTSSNLDFTGNTAAGNGGALYATAVELNVDSQWTFSGNTAGGHGGAIYLVYKTNADNTRTGAVLNATDVTFDGNTAMAGGAVSARSACTVNMNGTILTNNTVSGFVDDGKEDTVDNDGDGEGGGAVYVGYGTLNMTNVTATGNTASDFGGVVDAVASPVTITGGTFSGNAANNGGVIHAMSSSTVTITDATLKENASPTANTGYDSTVGGGAIHTVGGKLTISGTTLDGNTSGNYGGTIHASKTTVKIDGGSTVINSTGATGGALYFRSGSTVTLENITLTDNVSRYNGILYQGGGTLTMNKVSATGNRAVNGGVLYTSGGANVTLTDSTWSGNEATSGGAVYLTGATVNLVNSALTENTAKNGGAAYVTEGGTLNLTGTTFKNNTATTDGGAIYSKGGNVVGADTETAVNAFTENTATSSGGAIYVTVLTNETTQATTVGTLNVTGGTYTDNVSGTNGGAIAVYNGTTATIKDATFHGNEAKQGGAVYMSSDSVADLANLTFTENTATNNGGALYFHTIDVTASNLDFEKNTATGHGGAIYLCATELDLDAASSFSENTAGNHGGAVYLTYITNEDNTRTGAVLNANGSTFDGNTALAGGAISIRSACEANLDGTVLTNNRVEGFADKNDGDGEGGGAIYVGYGTLTMTNVTATGNTASDFGGVVDAVSGTVTVVGGIYEGNAAGNGGVLHALSNSVVSFNGSTLKNNESTFVQGETYDATKGGGAIHTVGGTLTLTDTILDGNKAGYYGGAIHTNKTTVTMNGGSLTNSVGATGAACYFAYNSVVTMEDVSVTDNTATGNGVIYILGTITMDNVTATDNTAYAGGVLYASGADTMATVKNSTFSGNEATEGGAVYLKVKATVNLENSTMQENTAKYGGVVNVYDGATLNLSGTTFRNNSATADGGAVYTKAAYVNGTDAADSVNTFTGNTAANHGGAVYVNYIKGEEGAANTPGVLTMNGGLFENNTALAGGAISARTSCQVFLTGTQLIGNEATCPQTGGAGGGAIYTNNGEMILSGVTMKDNVAEYYGGALYATSSKLSMTDNCVVSGNKGITGTALWFNTGSETVTLSDLTLTDNARSTGNSNGTIYAAGSGKLNITNLTASGNTSTNGGVLYTSGGLTITITDSTLTGNTALNVGGVVAYRGSGTLTITDTTMSGNTAVNGGAIEASGSGKVIVKNSTLESNTATKTGGAIYATGSAKVEISDNTTLKNNTALAGGAIFMDTGASVTINVATLEGNTATGTTDTDFGGSDGCGGAILVADTTKTDTSAIGNAATTLTLTNVTFKNNVANKQGGAVSTDESSPNLVITATNCIFDGNSATTKGGGAVEIKNGNQTTATDPTVVKLVLTNCTFIGNSCKTTGAAVEIRTSSCAKIDGINATNNAATDNGGVLYVTSNYSRLYLTGTVTISGNTAKSGTFAYLYNNKYTNPPRIYTTASNDAAWFSEVKGNTTSITFDMATLP